MPDESRIAWSAVSEGTPVFSSDGQEIGKISTVVADEQQDIFSGFALRGNMLANDRFVPADLVGEITTERVVITITSNEADERLEDYSA